MGGVKVTDRWSMGIRSGERGRLSEEYNAKMRSLSVGEEGVRRMGLLQNELNNVR